MYLRFTRFVVFVALINLPASLVSGQTVKPVAVGILSPGLPSIPPEYSNPSSTPFFIKPLRRRGNLRRRSGVALRIAG